MFKNKTSELIAPCMALILQLTVLVFIKGCSVPSQNGATGNQKVSENPLNPSVSAIAGPVSVAFEDTELQGGILGGVIEVARASNETLVDEYVIYWGISVSTILDGIPEIAVIKKELDNLSFAFPEPTSKPALATHFIVKTRNAKGQVSESTGILIVDKGVPLQSASGLAFVDTNPTGGVLQGTLSISKASKEDDLSHYVLYWGDDNAEKLFQTPIAVIGKTGLNLSYSLANTPVPAGAKYLLVFTKNQDGEMSAGINTLILDAGVPKFSAQSVSFTDGDPVANKIAGDVTIGIAWDESDVTDYVLYWGSSATAKLKSNNVPLQPIAVIPKTGYELSHTLSNTSLPSGASHLLVFTKNASGEMATGVFVALVDLGQPTATAGALAFTDTNVSPGVLGGDVTITKAASEDSFTHYVLYWGSSSTVKLTGAPAIARLVKQNSNLKYTFPPGTSKLTNYLLVYTAYGDGASTPAVEMSQGKALLVFDTGVPQFPPAGVSFTDTNPLGTKLTGDINITKANDESSMTEYVLYWGSSATVKSSTTAIATLPKNGSNLVYTFTDVIKPANATHLLVFSKNVVLGKSAERNQPAATLIIDLGPPTEKAGGIMFTDTDNVLNKLTGSVNFTKASSETNLTSYEVYWGSSSGIDVGKLSSTTGTTTTPLPPIASIAKIGSDFSFTLSAIGKPADATHFIVFTKNAQGENAEGISVAIVDRGMPLVDATSLAFTDTDSAVGTLTGTVSIGKATDESTLTEYVLYWGSNTGEKISATDGAVTPDPIATLAKTGGNLSHNLTAKPIPAGATCLMVYSKNTFGERASPVRRTIVDRGYPTVTAAAITFSDNDAAKNLLGGTLSITRASDESSLTHYVLYWGTSSTAKLTSTSGTTTITSPAIATIQKTSSSISYTFNFTAVPTSATHLLVFTKNNTLEMGTGIALQITDKAVPIHPASSVSFTDTAVATGKLFGDISIAKATDETDVTDYVIYWGTSATNKLSTTAVATLPKGGATLTHRLGTNSTTGAIDLPPGATHILVFTKNTDGEMSTPIAFIVNGL